MRTAVSVATPPANQCVPRGHNELHTIFEHHFADFCDHYEAKYATTYGIYRLERIQRIGERFSTCGDYLQGVARIRCTNPESGHDYFRPFSYKGFDLCPSCSRKRCARFFRHDRRLFADVSRLVYNVLCEFYKQAADRSLLTGMVVAHQTFGDMLRWNLNFRAIVLEDGFDDESTFFYIPFSGLHSMTEVFRHRVFKLLVERGLFHTTYSQYFKQNLHMFDALGCRASAGGIEELSPIRTCRTRPWLRTAVARLRSEIGSTMFLICAPSLLRQRACPATRVEL